MRKKNGSRPFSKTFCRFAFEEERALPDPDPLYYVVTLSNLTMVYKGLIQAEHLGDFYPDL